MAAGQPIWFASKVEILEHRINKLVAEAEVANQTLGSWRATADSLLATAKNATGNNTPEEMDKAWMLLKAATREVQRGSSDAERRATATALLEESVQLRSSWRAAALKKLLPATGPVITEDLIEAMDIADEDSDNYWRTLAARRENLQSAMVILIIGVAATLYAAYKITPDDFENLKYIAVLGFLGAGVSVTYGLAMGDLASKFPEASKRRNLVFTRPAIGAASAIATYLILKSGGLLGIDIKDEALFGYAFVAGFSERFIFKLSSKLEGKVTGA